MMSHAITEERVVLEYHDVSSAELRSILDTFETITFDRVELTIPGGTLSFENGSEVDQPAVDQPDIGTDADPSQPLVPTIRPDADPYYVIEALTQVDGWIASTDLRDYLDEETVNFDTISNTLWRLDHRGLVESRDHEADKRVQEYRLTQLGKQSYARAKEDASEPTTSPEPESVRIQSTGDPYHILETLVASDEWLTSDAILERADGINEDTISSTLWRLGERGLVDTRPHEADKRYKEYTVSSSGEAALEAAKARA